MGRLWVKVTAVLGLGLVVACGSSSDPVAGLMLTSGRASAGLDGRVVQTAAGPVRYLEGGKGQPVLMVHGIFARKEHWLQMSRRLTDRYRVIMIDLPGFGDNPPLGRGQYRLSRQADNLEAVMAALGLESAHIAASSMGGQIAGVVAARSPEKVRSLAFIGSPLGVLGPRQTDFERAALAGQAPMVVRNRADFDRRNALVLARPPSTPAAVLNAWAADEIATPDLNQRIWDEVALFDVTPLQRLAPRIGQPTLILWCKGDRVFHPSGGAVLERALPRAERRMMTGCGHLPMIDRPGRTGKNYREFLDRL